MSETRKRTRPRKRPAPTPEDIDVNAGVHVQHTQSGDVVDEDLRDYPGQYPTEPHAKVGVGCSVTQNMGDYNSVKVNVWAEMPCKPTEMHMRETKKGISEMIDRWVEEELDLATGKG